MYFPVLVCILFLNFYQVVALRSTKDPNFWGPLIKEVEDAGGYIHPDLHLKWFDVGGFTIVSENDIPHDTLIMRVPHKLTLKHEDILQDFPSWKNLSLLSNEANPGAFALALAYYANFSGPTPLYVKYAPDSCYNGHNMEPDLVVRMMDYRGQFFVLDYQKKMLEEWKVIQEAMRNGTIENDDILSSITLSRYTWATCLCYSRRYFRETGVSSILIPLGDMFNHDASYNTYWEYSKDNSSWAWFTTGVTKGQPITINYGSNKENLELFFVYGFIVKDNPNEVGYLLREVKGSIIESILHLFKDLDLYYLEFTKTGISNKELIFTRITYLPPHQQTSYHISKLIAGEILWPLELDLWTYFHRECNAQLIGIPGVSVEDDKILLEETAKILETKVSERARRYWQNRMTVLHYRIERRTLFRKMCSWIFDKLRRMGGNNN